MIDDLVYSAREHDASEVRRRLGLAVAECDALARHDPISWQAVQPARTAGRTPAKMEIA